MKKILSAVLTLTLLLSVTATAFAEPPPIEPTTIHPELSVRFIGPNDKFWGDTVWVLRFGEPEEEEEVIRIALDYKNLGTKTVENVSFLVNLSPELTYTAGSTLVYETGHPNGKPLPDGIVGRDGIIVGDYAPGQTAELRLSVVAKIPEGANISAMRIDGIIASSFEGNFMVNIIATVIEMKSTTPPPPELPTTASVITCPVTRSEAMVKIAEAMNAELPQVYNPIFADCDKDVKTTPYIQWAYENGITAGCGGGKFAPDSPLTWEQFAVILCRLAGLTPDGEKRNIQGARISPWAGPSITALADYFESIGAPPTPEGGGYYWVGNVFVDDPKAGVDEYLFDVLLGITLSGEWVHYGM